jgi:ATP-dependent protease ClpP protease subunit
VSEPTQSAGVPQQLEAAAPPQYRYWGSQKPPKRRADFFAISTAEGTSTAGVEGSSIATIRMYGPIDSWGGWWGISAEDISEALDNLGPDVSEIRLRINSPGGEVFEGLTILNMLRAHPATVVAVVDGLAASAGAVVAVGCDETVMSPGTQMMIHDVRTFAYGPPAVMRKVAAALDSMSDATAELFAEVAGGTAAQWRAVQIEETWYSAREADAAGLADRVAVVPDAGPAQTAGAEDDVETVEEEFEQKFDLSLYAYAGRSNAPAPRAMDGVTPKPPSASAVGNTHTPTGMESAVAFSDEQMKTMRAKLGVSEDADEATIVAALDEALEERAEPPTPKAPEASVPKGMKLVSETVFEDVTAKAERGAKAAEDLLAMQCKATLDKYKDRFPATDDARAKWEADYRRDPAGTEAYLSKAAVLVPTGEIGHAEDTDTDAPVSLADIQNDPTYLSWKVS